MCLHSILKSSMQLIIALTATISLSMASTCGEYIIRDDWNVGI